MNNVANDYIEVVVKYEEDEYIDDAMHILPDAGFLKQFKIKAEEPVELRSTAQATNEHTLDTAYVKVEEEEEDNDVIVLDANDYDDATDDKESLAADTLNDNYIVYELEDESEQAPAAAIQICTEAASTRTDIAPITSVAPALLAMPVTSVTFTKSALPIVRPKNGTITITPARIPKRPIVSSVVSIDRHISQLRKYPSTKTGRRMDMRPCISSRTFRIAGKRIGVPIAPAIADPLAPTVTDSSAPSAVKTIAPPTTTTANPIELKLKCMCRLSKPMPSTDSLASSLQVKYFFEQMFHETRRLNPRNRRIIQSALLSAVCEAEDDVEAGKYCEKCYAN